ncbi:MAG: bile acid:sodium symporter family protein [Cytophagales bacterium]|nr:bile acid:sodium symporter family protein [Cytophagales bacterium]
MKNKKLLSKILMASAFLCLIVFVIIYLTDSPTGTGPFLTAFFVLLAISFNGFDSIKSFSYTIWIFAAVTASMYFPQYFVKAGDFELKRLIVPLLQIIMFGMGSQMSVKDFAGVIKMPKGVIIGLICQFTIMPIIGITIASAFDFPPEIAAGIILVGSSPSGLASNVMSFIAKANLALSVTLTAIATLLAPLVTPTLMSILAQQYVPIDFWSMMLGIFNMVILPIIAGLVFNSIAYAATSNKRIAVLVVVSILIVVGKNLIFMLSENVSNLAVLHSAFTDIFWFILIPILAGFGFRTVARGSKEFLGKAMAFVSMLGIGVIITIITASGRDSLLEMGLLLILACLLHNMLGYFLGYWTCKLARMDEKSCRTIALEVGMQNGGLASGIALQMGKVATVGLAPAVFGPMMNITGSSLATFWRGKKTKEE